MSNNNTILSRQLKVIDKTRSRNYITQISLLEILKNENLPEKLSLLNSYSRTLRPLSKISSALAPRTVQWTAIFSLRRIPKDLTVYLALENTGC